jgi:hypothetical protein
VTITRQPAAFTLGIEDLWRATTSDDIGAGPLTATDTRILTILQALDDSGYRVQNDVAELDLILRSNLTARGISRTNARPWHVCNPLCAVTHLDDVLVYVPLAGGR